MNRYLVWLSRIHCCRGFGIQSPTDYAFVRYVVNEHWPYYAYDVLRDDDWLREKLGRLFMRLANWRQPTVILSDDYLQWFHAGCHQSDIIPLASDIRNQTSSIELARITIDQWDRFLPLRPTVRTGCRGHSTRQGAMATDSQRPTDRNNLRPVLLWHRLF